MHRLEDWSLRMEAAIDAARTIPFGYRPGRNHCCKFTGDVVLEMTGRDPIAWFRGRYKTEKGAYLALLQFAGGGLAEAMERIAAEFPLEEIRPTHAQRGDAVMFEMEPGNPGLGICVGHRLVSVLPDTGLGFVAMSAALRAWRV